MRGVILDAESLGNDIDLTPVTTLLDDWTVYGTTSPAQTADRIAEANIVLTNKIVIDDSILAAARQVRFISVMATGTNNIDLDATQKAGVKVANAVAYATPSVVQHTMSLILTLATHLPDYLRDVQDGKWHDAPAFCLLNHPITELSGKILGIVGFGELGSNVAQVAKAFGMKIRVAQRDGTVASNNERMPLRELLREVDYLSLHCPLTPQNASLINRETLSLMKPDACLINTARGGLVNSNDLIDALQAGTIRAAAIDVLNQEPPVADEPLLQQSLPNLIVTPHNAWGALEARQRLLLQMRENIEAFLKGEPVRLVQPTA